MVVKVKRNTTVMAPLGSSNKEDDGTIGSGGTISRKSALLAVTQDDNSSTRRLLAAIDCLSEEMKRDIGQEALYKRNIRHAVEKSGGRRPPSRSNSSEHLGGMRRKAPPSRSNSGEGLRRTSSSGGLATEGSGGARPRRSSKEGIICNKSVLSELSAELGMMSSSSRKAPSRSNSGESLKGMRRTGSRENMLGGNGGIGGRKAPPARTSSGEGLRGALRRTLSNENLRGGGSNNRRRNSKEGLQPLRNKSVMADLSAED